jgi:hypothetical protein
LEFKDSTVWVNTITHRKTMLVENTEK